MIRSVILLCCLCVPVAAMAQPRFNPMPARGAAPVREDQAEQVENQKPEPPAKAVPGHFANAAERMLNDPHFMFDQEAAEGAAWEDVRKGRQEERKQVQEERKQRVMEKGGAGRVARAGPATRHPTPNTHYRRSYNRPRQVPAIEAYQAMMYQQYWQRANVPMLYGRR